VLIVSFPRIGKRYPFINYVKLFFVEGENLYIFVCSYEKMNRIT